MKNKLAFILICTIFCTSCRLLDRTISRTFPSRSSVCPTNDSRFFFRQAGARPTKQYLRNNRH